MERVGSPKQWRVLGIYPTSRRFAFAVVEEEQRLVDYGALKALTDDEFSEKLASLCDFYQPDVLALESDRKSRRRAEARARIALAIDVAAEMHVASAKVSIAMVHEVLDTTDRQTLIERIVESFPEIALKTPRKRSVDGTEDERMYVFRAVARALAVLITLRT